jgi:hypothetical protein
MEYENAVIDQRMNTITIRQTGITVSNINIFEKTHRITASLADIEKVL